MKICRTRARSASLVTVLVAVAITVTAFAVPAQAAASDAALGTKNPAKGTPVKIGFITDGKGTATDNSIESDVADAAVKWINQYRNGIGGHPIELDTCVTGADPSKSVDCANQMIQDDVAAVLFGSNQFTLNSWTPLHASGIPTFLASSGNANIKGDTTSTFVFNAGLSALQTVIVGSAKAAKIKKATVVVIDVPAATQIFADTTPFEKAGLSLDVVPVALGTADMTPQMQKVVSNNPKGEVFVLGNDTFCIAAFNGLRTAGFKGLVTTGSACLSDATRTAVPADFLKGIIVSATSPIDTPKDPSMKQYAAVLDKFGASGVDKTRATGATVFQGITGMNVATQALKGDATPATIIAAAKAMPWSVLPASGGYHFRCNGKASAAEPATCTNALLLATLDAKGKATSYNKVNDAQIPG
jgi:branched-chain amino acid transport system substrate-binding protein